MGWLWFSLLLLFIPWTFFCCAITITIKLKRLGYQVKFWDKVMYATTISFLRTVTPANFISDPYTIFWLKTHGISTSKASAITVCNDLLWETAQLFITLPSFIWIITKWQDIFGSNVSDPQNGLIVFILMLIGITINFIALAFMIISGFSRKLHYLTSRIFNRFKKLLRLSYHTKEQTYQTYVVDAKLQKEFLIMLKFWKTTIIILLIVIINEFYLYFTIVWSLQYLACWDAAPFYINNNNWFRFFNVANVTTTANRFVPLPGGELSIEWIMQEFMSRVGGLPKNEEAQHLINNSIMVWRCWSNYLPAIIGIFGFGSLTISQIKQYRSHNRKQ